MCSWYSLVIHGRLKLSYIATCCVASHQLHGSSNHGQPDSLFNIMFRVIAKNIGSSTLMALCEGTWWRHQMETFSALLAICAENSPVPGEFPSWRPVTRSFDVWFDLRLTKRLSKQSWGWWFETLSSPLWRHSNETPRDGSCDIGLRLSITPSFQVWHSSL